jgi:NADH:ubiquinone oxidoreductase subunit 5 (subunit L)/multisubunit Na+/H+ antiporter MnhA subunit
MAKPAAKAPAKGPARPMKAVPVATKAQMGSGTLILWAIAFVSILFLLTGSVILLLIGMAPTIVAYLIDRTPKKFAAWCVGGMNFTGVLPSFLKYWDRGESVRNAIAVAFNPFDLTVMYGAAAFGWMLYQAIPPVVAAMIAVSAQHRIAKLRARQRELIKEWGEALALAPKED